MGPRLRLATSIAIALAPLACNALVGDYQADLPAPIESQHLCTVERERFTFQLDLEAPAQFSDLTAYYDQANPTLIAHLDGVAQSFRNGDSGVGVTYMMGAAGVGKSFAARNVFEGFSDDEKCTIKLSSLFKDEKDKLDFDIVQTPDLTTIDGQVVFNTLPSVADVPTFDLARLFEAAGCNEQGTLPPLIVIDDLDEVHDETCLSLLRQVDEFILQGAPGAGAFLHIVVVGRPEGFATWRTDPARTEQSNAFVEVFTLLAPRYQTAGDLQFRVRGYLDFTDQLESIEASGELGAYFESVTNAVVKYPFLTYSIGNLSVGNVVVEHTAPELNESQQELKSGLFDDIVGRAASTHGRPEPGSALGGAYLRLLEDIAVRYADVSEEGDFAVRSEDTIDAFDDEGAKLGQVRVRDVLNRGGVAMHVSATAINARYRFDPFWLHAHLIERQNRRNNPYYEYVGCK